MLSESSKIKHFSPWPSNDSSITKRLPLSQIMIKCQFSWEKFTRAFKNNLDGQRSDGSERSPAQHILTNYYTAAQSHFVSCFFLSHTQHEVAVAANHSNSFSHKHALPVTGNPFSIALPFSGTLSHIQAHIPTAPHSGKPLNSTGQHIDTQPHKTFPYHSLLPSLEIYNYLHNTPKVFLCNIRICLPFFKIYFFISMETCNSTSQR